MCSLDIGTCAKDDGIQVGVCVQRNTGNCLPFDDLPVDDEVCGCDGITYTNPCEALRAGKNIQKKGKCSSSPCITVGFFDRFEDGDFPNDLWILTGDVDWALDDTRAVTGKVSYKAYQCLLCNFIRNFNSTLIFFDFPVIQYSIKNPDFDGSLTTKSGTANLDVCPNFSGFFLRAEILANVFPLNDRFVLKAQSTFVRWQRMINTTGLPQM